MYIFHIFIYSLYIFHQRSPAAHHQAHCSPSIYIFQISIYFHIFYIFSIYFPPIFHQKSPAIHNQACYSPSKYNLRIYHIRRGFFVGYFEILRPMDCTLDKIPWEVAFAGQNVLLQEISVPKSINSYSVDSKCIFSSTFFFY